MTEELLVESILDIGDKIDTLWNMFIYINIGIAGFIVIHRDKNLHLMEFIVGFGAYCWFAFINSRALINTYALLDVFHRKYQATYFSSRKFEPDFYDKFVSLQYTDRPDMIYATHGAVIFVVFMSFVFKSNWYAGKYGKNRSKPE